MNNSKLQDQKQDQETRVANDFCNIFVRGKCAKWRIEWDSNPRYTRMHAGFQDRFLKPLGHLSTYFYTRKTLLKQA